ncbi:MAG: amino acid deaminase, partial [Burkholderiaceae bacterium]
MLASGTKGFPAGAAPCALEDVGARGWNILRGDLPFPLAVLRRRDLEHNLAWMQAYADRKGVSFAPHGKTTMSPELFRMQLAHGAWGITFATVAQLAVGLQAGVRRAVIANQVVSGADLAGLAGLLATHPGSRAWFLVDSLAQLALIESWARDHAGAPVFDVLLEMGAPGQRTGCRTLAQAMDLAQAMSRSRAVRLGGIECYEGLMANGDSAHDVEAVSSL